MDAPFRQGPYAALANNPVVNGAIQIPLVPEDSHAGGATLGAART